MVDCGPGVPSLISIVGVDGSGKTTLANWLADELVARGCTTRLVWSRFRNYLSKPLLAMTRLTGHNHYEQHDGVRFGFHDFERLAGYRELFAVLQAVDVNIAAWSRIQRMRDRYDVVICERGPWDTLVDVTADTGLAWLPGSALGASYGRLMRRDACVIRIARSMENILRTRPELVHDYKLQPRMAVYEQLAARFGWYTVDNNGTLDAARQAIMGCLGLDAAGPAGDDHGGGG